MELESTNIHSDPRTITLELIENGDSWVSISQTTEENGITISKMSTPATAEEKTKKKNDVKARDLEQIHKRYLEAMDLKWQLSLLSVRAKKYYQKTGKKIFINGNDIVGYDKSKVECYNCHKLGHFAKECRASRSKEDQFRNQDNTSRTDQTNMALMAFSNSEIYTDKTCSKTCLNNYETLKKQYDDLLAKQHQQNMMQATYKEIRYCLKHNIPPPHPLIYNRPNKLDMSYSGLDEFKEPEFKGYAENSKERVLDDEEQDESITKPKNKTVIPTAAKIEKPVKKSVRPRIVNTARSYRTPVNTVRPRVVNTARQNRTSVNAARGNWGKPQHDDKGFVDSGCSRHMTGNIAYLSDFKQFDGGYVAFGGGAYGGKILKFDSHVAKATLDESMLGTEDMPDGNTVVTELNVVGPSTSTARSNEEDSTEEEPEDGDADDVDVHLYRSMIGSLMYLTASRPDIMFAGFSFELVAYTDSDYTGATLDRKSTTGGCLRLQSIQSIDPPLSRGYTLRSGEDSMKLIGIDEILLKLVLSVLISAVKCMLMLPVQVSAVEVEAYEDLHLDDAEGTDCLPTATIFEELARMGITTAGDDTTTTRPKDRGVVVQEPSEFRVPQEIKPSSSKDKGKGIMIEPEVPLKRKDQIALDEQIARDIQAKLDVELLEEQKLARKPEKEAKIALIDSWENTQAMMKADRLLAERLQSKEREELTDEEKAKLFMELMEKRRKHFAALRAQEKRNRPPTKAQKRTQMSTYLKHMGGYTYKQLKGKSFDEIQKLFDKEMKRVNTFVAMGSEVQENKEKKEEGREETAKGSRKKIKEEKEQGKNSRKNP
ncbi:putative ribonuclease H-like domain-containing protein [Tanacetum coccineum]